MSVQEVQMSAKVVQMSGEDVSPDKPDSRCLTTGNLRRRKFSFLANHKAKVGAWPRPERAVSY